MLKKPKQPEKARMPKKLRNQKKTIKGKQAEETKKIPNNNINTKKTKN